MAGVFSAEGTFPPANFSKRSSIPSPFPTITAAFLHQVSTYPGVVAVRDLSRGPDHVREITYGDLARRSGAMAQHLLRAGVQPGDRVPLVVKRSIEMVIGIFAILMCGAQYIPLDGGVVPDSTLKVVISQSNARVVVCLSSTKGRLASFGDAVRAAVLDETAQEDAAFTGELIDLSKPEHGCYIIYTSGTTGAPKGVDVTHKNVANLVCLAPGNLGIGPGVKVGQLLNISFDMAAWEMLGCMANGGTLVVRGSNWKDTIKEIQVLICTPTILAQYDPAQYPNIRTVATAGEPSSQGLADQWATHGQYFNCCGPTETTIVNTMHLHVPGTPLSIGQPTPNNIVYILDEDHKPVRVGESGVMWASGSGISKGYVGRPDLTKDKYKEDPFTPGEVMYNTGDLGRWRQDGLIDILGRVDDQVKIKGFRVELDGVAASVASFEGVSRAAALMVGKEIHAFLTPKGIDESLLADHLKAKQPYYAIPSKIHQLDSLPETRNGKIDKRALKAMVELEASSASQASSTSLVPTEKPASLGTGAVYQKALSSNSSFAETEKLDLSKELPGKELPQPWRGLFYRVFIVYRELFSLIFLANLAILIVFFVSGPTPEALSTAVAINLVIAVLVRQDFVINLLYTVTCSVPRWLPLGIRTRCARIFHLGGAHSGAAFCAGFWLLASNINDSVCRARSCPDWTNMSLAGRTLSWILSGFFMIMFTMAWPSIRKQYHNYFERTHRFLGWTMLALFWAQTIVASNDARRDGQSLGAVVVRNHNVWLLLVATCSVAMSWLFLRKVDVDAEVLSNHAVRLHFDYTVPVNGSFARLALGRTMAPLLEWHSFATIPAPQPVNGRPKGFSLVVSNAGDWTKACIQNPPTKIWVRSVPTCGVMRIATLFNRLVIIGTGSGIGPLLGHIQNNSGTETRLIWSTKNPEQTYGQGLIDAIKTGVPNTIIHDTTRDGRPDLVKMGYNLAKSFDAEAVIIIANEKITKKVVYGLETRGIPAYGAIWDS